MIPAPIPRLNRCTPWTECTAVGAQMAMQLVAGSLAEPVHSLDRVHSIMELPPTGKLNSTNSAQSRRLVKDPLRLSVQTEQEAAELL